jgi:hypothetical protein
MEEKEVNSYFINACPMKKILTLVLASAALPALAHPGHGSQNPLSPGHYVSNPEHSIPIALAVAVTVVLVTWLASRRQRISK